MSHSTVLMPSFPFVLGYLFLLLSSCGGFDLIAWKKQDFSVFRNRITRCLDSDSLCRQMVATNLQVYSRWLYFKLNASPEFLGDTDQESDLAFLVESGGDEDFLTLRQYVKDVNNDTVTDSDAKERIDKFKNENPISVSFIRSSRDKLKMKEGRQGYFDSSDDTENSSIQDSDNADDQMGDNYRDTTKQYSEEELNSILEMVFDDRHKQDLNKKVEAAIEDDWDEQQGVNPGRLKSSLPITANVDLWSYSARQLLMKGDFAGSMALYERCVEYDPCDGRAWLGMGRIHWKRRDIEAAEKCYRDGLYYSPKNAYLMQGYAVMLEKLGRLSEATKLLVASVKSNPNHAASWIALAKIYERSSSLAALSGGGGGDLRSGMTSRRLGQSLKEVGIKMQNRMRSSMNQLIGYGSNNNIGNVDNIGVDQLVSSEPELTIAEQQISIALNKCRQCYEAAVRGDSRSYVALHGWAVLESRTGNYTAARQLFQRCLTIAPKSIYAMQSWAKMEIESDSTSSDYDGDCESGSESDKLIIGGLRGVPAAEKLLSKALRDFPTSTRIRLSCAEVYQLKGEIDNARIIFQDGARFADKFGDAGFLQAWAIFEERFYYRYKRNDNDNDNGNIPLDGPRFGPGSDSISSTNNNLYEQYVDTVRGIYRRAIAANKYHSASWIGWAKFEEKQGNLEAARKLLIAGISKFPASKNIAWFHCSLANLARKSGDFHTARACYRRALDTSPVVKSLAVILEFARFEEAAAITPLPSELLPDSPVQASESNDSNRNSNSSYISNRGNDTCVLTNAKGNYDTPNITRGVSLFSSLDDDPKSFASGLSSESAINGISASITDRLLQRRSSGSDTSRSSGDLREKIRRDVLQFEAAETLYELAVQRFPREGKAKAAYQEFVNRRLMRKTSFSTSSSALLPGKSADKNIWFQNKKTLST